MDPNQLRVGLLSLLLNKGKVAGDHGGPTKTFAQLREGILSELSGTLAVLAPQGVAVIVDGDLRMPRIFLVPVTSEAPHSVFDLDGMTFQLDSARRLIVSYGGLEGIPIPMGRMSLNSPAPLAGLYADAAWAGKVAGIIQVAVDEEVYDLFTIARRCNTYAEQLAQIASFLEALRSPPRPKRVR